MNEDPDDVSQALESRLEDFDRSWHSGKVPTIDDFLSCEASDNDDATRWMLIELIMIDQEQRWRRSVSRAMIETSGEEDCEVTARCHLPTRPRLKDYVRQYPELGELQELPPRVLSNEYRILQRWGNRPKPAEYLAGFPEYVDRLEGELTLIEARASQADCMASLTIRCPHCHATIELTESDLGDLSCPSCSGRFNLLGEHAEPQWALDRRLGRFRLIEKIGAGNFGTVWRACDEELNREVALKVPRRGQLTIDETEQFLREARSAAQLRHPNIVSILEVGRDGDTVYIVSEYVQGASLADWLADQKLSSRRAAELCAKVAEALHHAHEAGVVHRDLKPSNIMLDADGQPFVMDFGLARREAGEVTMTVDGKVVGTPAYMPPEQARGEAHNADGRSDVYSLGVILFELLTGERPFRGNVRMMLQHVIHDEAPNPRRLNSNVPRDLETICLKCLEKDPAKRYGSAEQLADELRRFLHGKPIQARPISSVARTWRWCKRNPMGAAAAALLLLLAVVGPLVAIRESSHAAREAKARENSRHRLYISEMIAAHRAWDANNIDRVLELLARHVPEVNQQDLRGFEWYYLWRLCRRSAITPSFEHGGPTYCVAFSPDGTSVASGGGRTVKRWNVRSGRELPPLKGHEDKIKGVAFSPNGKTLASASWDGTLRLWDLEADDVSIIKRPFAFFSVAFSSDGNTLATNGLSASVMLWDVQSGQLLCELKGHKHKERGVHCVAFSQDGQLVASGSLDGTVSVWDVDNRELRHVFDGHRGWVEAVTFSPNGAILASGSKDDTVKLWHLATGEEMTELTGHTSDVVALEFSPNGKTLASASWDNSVKLWDVVSGVERDALRHSSYVQGIAFSRDGRQLSAAGADGIIKVWSLPASKQHDTLNGVGAVLSPDGKKLATWTQWRNEDIVELWDPTNCQPMKTTLQRGDAYSLFQRSSVAFSRDGKILATGMPDGNVEVWEIETGVKRRLPGRRKGPVTFVAYSPDGKTLASAGRDDTVKLWDVGSSELLTTLPVSRATHCTFAYPFAFSPDSKTVATVEGETLHWTLKLHDITGTELTSFEESNYRIDALAFSPNGKTLAAGDRLGTVKLWDVSRQEVKHTLIGHAQRIYCVAFCRDENRLATGSADGSVKLWDVETGHEIVTLEGHAGSVLTLQFSHDGMTLVSAGDDNTVRLWRRASEEEVLAADRSPRVSSDNLVP